MSETLVGTVWHTFLRASETWSALSSCGACAYSHGLELRWGCGKRPKPLSNCPFLGGQVNLGELGRSIQLVLSDCLARNAKSATGFIETRLPDPNGMISRSKDTGLEVKT